MQSSPCPPPLLALVLLALACGGEGEGAPDDLERACRQLIACEAESAPSSMRSVEQCRQDLSSQYDAAATDGCAGVYADLVACYAMVPLVCSMEGPGSCEAVQSALDTCLNEG